MVSSAIQDYFLFRIAHQVERHHNTAARNTVFNIKLMWICVLDLLHHRGLSFEHHFYALE